MPRKKGYRKTIRKKKTTSPKTRERISQIYSELEAVREDISLVESGSSVEELATQGISPREQMADFKETERGLEAELKRLERGEKFKGRL